MKAICSPGEGSDGVGDLCVAEFLGLFDQTVNPGVEIGLLQNLAVAGLETHLLQPRSMNVLKVVSLRASRPESVVSLVIWSIAT